MQKPEVTLPAITVYIKKILDRFRGIWFLHFILDE